MSRRGYTLIEVLAVIAVSTVLMGIAIEVLYLLSRAESGGRKHAGQAAIVARLADQFRGDVHAALHPTAAENAEKNQWQFTLADRTATYRALPGEVQRYEQIAGKTTRRESYVLPADSTAEILVRADPAPATASLVITLPGPASEIGRDIRIDAVFSRDHRFAKLPNGRQ